ncbi:MAG: hypothetical protein WCE40_04600 [Polyangia bacterium]
MATEEDGAKFLDRDFNQCFNQMRHHDSQILEIVKFALTAYAALVGAALAFYKYGLDKGADYRSPGVAISIVGLMLGIALLALVIRNRAYFVLVARYINEHRAFFLKDRPLGFANVTRMYTNPSQPQYFNWRSSQALLCYSLAILNSGLLGLVVYFIFDKSQHRWWMVGIGGVLLLGAQLGPAIAYLKSREGKSASEAVFGRE